MIIKNTSDLSTILLSEICQGHSSIQRLSQYLLDGADINYQSSQDGYTALMLAVDQDNEPLVSYLLNEGANPLIKNYYGEISSDIALTYSPIYQHLKNHELLFASLINDIAVAKSAIYSGANIHFQGSGGYTLKMLAIEQNHLELVDFFERFN